MSNRALLSALLTAIAIAAFARVAVAQPPFASLNKEVLAPGPEWESIAAGKHDTPVAKFALVQYSAGDARLTRMAIRGSSTLAEHLFIRQVRLVDEWENVIGAGTFNSDGHLVIDSDYAIESGVTMHLTLMADLLGVGVPWNTHIRYETIQLEITSISLETVDASEFPPSNIYGVPLTADPINVSGIPSLSMHQWGTHLTHTALAGDTAARVACISLTCNGNAPGPTTLSSMTVESVDGVAAEVEQVRLFIDTNDNLELDEPDIELDRAPYSGSGRVQFDPSRLTGEPLTLAPHDRRYLFIAYDLAPVVRDRIWFSCRVVDLALTEPTVHGITCPGRESAHLQVRMPRNPQLSVAVPTAPNRAVLPGSMDVVVGAIRVDAIDGDASLRLLRLHALGNGVAGVWRIRLIRDSNADGAFNSSDVQGADAVVAEYTPEGHDQFSIDLPNTPVAAGGRLVILVAFSFVDPVEGAYAVRVTGLETIESAPLAGLPAETGMVEVTADAVTDDADDPEFDVIVPPAPISAGMPGHLGCSAGTGTAGGTAGIGGLCALLVLVGLAAVRRRVSGI